MKLRAKPSAATGFTLLEMLIVLSIIAIMLVVATPSGSGRLDQRRVKESADLVAIYQPQIATYYLLNAEFPESNNTLGMPAPQRIIGNYLTAVYLVDGALHLELGNKIRAQLKGKVLSLRPVFVPDTENAPISWICGNDTVPGGMIAMGENRTNIDSSSLPISCR